MPLFELQGPDGARYQIDAPDQGAAFGAFQKLSGPPQPAPRAPVSGNAPSVQLMDPATGQMRPGPVLSGVPSALPTIGRAADDAVRSVASGATFGLADEAAAGAKALTGNGTYDSNLASERARDKEIPAAIRIPGEIAGGVMTGTGLGRAGITLMNAARPTLGSMALRGAAEGAAYGAANGFGHGEGAQDRLGGAVKGAGIGALTGGATGAVAGRMAQGAARDAIPTTDGLRAQANTAYDAADAAGLVVNPQSFGNAVGNIAARVQEEGIDPTLHPAATRVLARLGEAVQNGTPLTLRNLETLRRVANGATRDPMNPDQARIARIVVDGLDDYMHGLQPGDVLAGDAQAGAAALTQARDLWSRFRKSETIDDLVHRAELRASQFSGSGYENALRTEFRRLAMNDRALRGFTDDERTAIERVARGGPVENVLRMVGKFAPTGVVSSTLSGGAGAGLGNAIAGAPGATIGAMALPALGLAARQGATAMTGRNARAVSDLVRSGGAIPLPGPLTDYQRALLQTALIGQAQQLPQALPMPMGLLGPRVNTGR